MTAAACPRRVRDEVSDVLSCLNEALRHPGIATALALLLSGKRPAKTTVLQTNTPPSRRRQTRDDGRLIFARR